MAENNTRVSEIQRTLSDSFQRMTDMSIDTMKPLVENMFDNATKANKQIISGKVPRLNLSNQKGNTSHCSPPEETCPPHCIATITRQAMANERIIVPFLVKNECATTKTYRVGVRELEDMDGNLAPSQPVLNKTTVTLAPGRKERVLMVIDLSGYSNGTEYATEIVLREKEFNQNICFRLRVNYYDEITAVPFSEKKFKIKWQNWQSHFYCEPKKGDRVITEKETADEAVPDKEAREAVMQLKS
ncbi:MAG: hypothetical protein GQ574_17870 [Crocinitomix sp.]|nr:hypothetical protein [Crocinitomix sp.]